MENTLEAGMLGPAQIILTILALALVILWIKTLIEIANSKFTDGSKTTWLLIVLLLGGLGLIIYYAAGRSKRIVNQDNDSDVVDQF